MLAGRQYPSLRCGGARSALSCLSYVLSWEVFFSAVVLRFLVPAFHVFLCCSEDGLALFWRLGALRVAVLTRSRLLVFRILFRGGFLLGAFSAGPAPPVVQLWARVEEEAVQWQSFPLDSCSIFEHSLFLQRNRRGIVRLRSRAERREESCGGIPGNCGSLWKLG